MKVFGTFILSMLMVSGLSAVTVMWNVPNSSGDWAKTAESTAAFTAYLVYNESATTDVATIADTAVNGGANVTTLGVNATWADKVTVGMNNITGHSGTGEYYLVIFKGTGTPTETSEYAVSTGMTYVKGSSNDKFYDQAADGGTPEAGGFIDIDGWMGGTYSEALAPEPTLLALLSLGLAGFVLKRRVA